MPRMRSGISASVPNTYAATQASLKTWKPGPRKLATRAAMVDLPEGLATAPCECGRRKVKGPRPCPTCAALDAAWWMIRRA